MFKLLMLLLSGLKFGKLLTTGGTIDKIYFDDKSDYQVGEPQIGRILKELGVVIPFTVVPVMRKELLMVLKLMVQFGLGGEVNMVKQVIILLIVY